MGQVFTREGPAQDEVQIIGVELAAQPPQLNGAEVELDMFACRHTLPIYNDGYYQDTEIRVTLHTSRGDRTIRGYVRW